jgi:hypothetical protein
MHQSLTPGMEEVLEANNFKKDSKNSYLTFKEGKKVNVLFSHDSIRVVKSLGQFTIKQTSVEVPYLDPIEFQTLFNILTR